VVILGAKGRLGGRLARMWAHDYEVRALRVPSWTANLAALKELLEAAPTTPCW